MSTPPTLFIIRDCGVGIVCSLASEVVNGLHDLDLVRKNFEELQQLVVAEFGTFSARILERLNATE